MNRVVSQSERHDDMRLHVTADGERRDDSSLATARELTVDMTVAHAREALSDVLRRQQIIELDRRESH